MHICAESTVRATAVNDSQGMGIFDKAAAEEAAEMLGSLSAKVRKDAGLELNPDHTTKLPTVWIFRIASAAMSAAAAIGILFLNFKFVSRDEAESKYVSKEVFEGLVKNTAQTAAAVTSINESILAMRGTMAELAAKAQKDMLQDERIKRNEDRLDVIMQRAGVPK